MVVRDLWSRRLLQTRSGEEHLGGSLAELGPCLPPQRGLGERSRSKLGPNRARIREAAANDSGSSSDIAAASASSVRPKGSCPLALKPRPC